MELLNFRKVVSLILESTNVKVSSFAIYNMNGVAVRKGQNHDLDNKIQINGVDLVPGVYVLEVEMENGFRQSFKVSRW